VSPSTDSAAAPAVLNDPIVRELIKSRFVSARREVEALVERTAMSPVVREKKDYFVAFFSDQGHLVTGTNLPLGARAIDAVIDRFPVDRMVEGDLFAYNDPYESNGGVSHLPDFLVVRPVFLAGRVVAFVQIFSHMMDVGGVAPGSQSTTAREIFHEGFRIPPVRLRARDQIEQGIWNIVLANTRFPNMLEGDLRSLIAAADVSAERLAEIFGHFGVETTQAAITELLEQGRAIVRNGLLSLPDGEYTFRQPIDAQYPGAEVHHIELTLIKNGDSVTVDTRRSSDQSLSPINFLMHPSVLGLMYGAYFMKDDPTMSLNGGMVEGLGEVLLRKGSILSPRFPAAVGMRGITWGLTNNAVLGTLAQADVESAPAGSGSYVVYYLRGLDSQTGQYTMFVDGIGVGYGAKPWADGLDSVYYLAQKNLPVEFIEGQWPVRMLGYEFRRDSGGPGRYRGGVGVVRRVQVLRDGLSFSSRLSNIEFPPWGTNGGEDGRSGFVVRNPGTDREQRLDPICPDTLLNAGDVVEIHTSGGGGYGDPYERDPEAVRMDVLANCVSVEGARRDYGVVLDAKTFDLDIEATTRLRERTAAD
jgi:N-methylhydantoinase B